MLLYALRLLNVLLKIRFRYLASFARLERADNQVLLSSGTFLRLCYLVVNYPGAFDTFLNGGGKAVIY